MIIKKIHLTHFKNYQSLDLEFHPRFNVIVGNNGMGKTNLVDAIHYLALTKSNFSSGERFVIMLDKDFMRLQGEFHDPVENSPSIITARIKRQKLKIFSKNETDYERLSEHIGHIPLVIIAPKDMLLILEGSKDRRRFLNKCLIQCDPQYLKHLTTYRRLLKQRNAYLKSSQQMGFNETYLHSLDAQMPEPAHYIYESRKLFIQELEPLFDKLYEKISAAQESMNLKYKSPLSDRDMADILKSNRDKDLILGRTTEGIHKDDIQFFMDGEVMKYFASQGQQKSLIYALKLAQYEYLKSHNQHLPILILDDVFDKLDPSRVKQLIHQLNNKEFGQVFLTDTDVDRLGHIMNQLGVDFVKFTVDNGIVDSSSE